MREIKLTKSAHVVFKGASATFTTTIKTLAVVININSDEKLLNIIKQYDNLLTDCTWLDTATPVLSDLLNDTWQDMLTCLMKYSGQPLIVQTIIPMLLGVTTICTGALAGCECVDVDVPREF